MEFDEKTVARGLDVYQRIMAMVQTVDISSNAEFQRLYKGFYKLRQKKATFYKAYFSFFQQQKTNNPTFRQTIEFLYKETNEVHFSFSSKLVASINPMKPILDKYVMRWMGFEIIDGSKLKPEERIDKYCHIYETIEAEYLKHLHDKNIVSAIARFDHFYPQYSTISPVKKLDCFLYGRGDGDGVSILDFEKLKEDCGK